MHNHEAVSRDISIEYRDLAGAETWMRDICGPHRLTASKPQQIRFQHRGNVLRATATVLGYIEYGTDVSISLGSEGELNAYSLSLPLVGEQYLTSTQAEQHSHAECALILSPDKQLALHMTGNCRKLQAVIPRQAVQQKLEQMLGHAAPVAVTFSETMDLRLGSVSAWWRMANYLFGELAAERGFYNGVAQELEDALIKGLLLTQPHNYSDELHRQQRERQPHYLQHALEMIHRYAREDLNLEEIERAAGVSRFKLFEAFRRHLGTTPMAYLKRHRLEAVRQALLRAPGDQQVSAIALEWGFTHLGRFANDYRRLFGEQPSQTLQRARQHRLR